MSVVTTRPTTTIDGGGVTVEGPEPGAAAALADDLDTTYVRLTPDPDHPFWAFGDPTIPAGAVVKGGRLRARARKLGNSPLVNWRMIDPEGSAEPNIFGERKRVSIPSTTETTYTVMNDLIAGPHVTPTNIVADVYVYGTDPDLDPIHLYALYFDTIIVVRPVADVIAPAQGSTVTADTTPTIRWNSTLDSDGGGQSHYQVKLFNSAQANPTAGSAVNESGILAGADTSWTPTDSLADGTWFAYVRIAQTVNTELHWSAWGSGTATSFNSFTVTINRPGVPVMTLTAESSSGRIKVDLDDTAGSATTSLFQVEVSDDAGVTWEPLRTASGFGLLTPTGGLATGYDYEAPIGATRSFRARSQHLYPEGSAASAWTATASSSWTSSLWWVKNLTDPSLNMNVLPRSQPSTTRAGRMGVFQPLDAKYPVAVLDKRSSASGEIVFRFDTNAARGSFEALCDEASIVLIQAPSDVVDWPDRFCALGDYERERVSERSNDLYSFDSVQWTEVARP